MQCLMKDYRSDEDHQYQQCYSPLNPNESVKYELKGPERERNSTRNANPIPLQVQIGLCHVDKKRLRETNEHPTKATIFDINPQLKT